jgi:hypothetical protein
MDKNLQKQMAFNKKIKQTSKGNLEEKTIQL